MTLTGPPIREVRTAAYRVPTDAPEADGTLSWDATTIIVVHIEAVETALWDAAARLLDVPLATMLGRCMTRWRCTAAAGSPATTTSNCATSCSAGPPSRN